MIRDDRALLALIIFIALFAVLMYLAAHPAPPAGDAKPSAALGRREVDRFLPEASGGEPLLGESTATTVPATPAPVPRIIRGIASTYGDEAGTGHWNGWVAWPDGPGWRLLVRGRRGFVTVISNDAGPDLEMQRQGRIIDLGPDLFELVSGYDWHRGLAHVRVTVLGRAR